MFPFFNLWRAFQFVAKTRIISSPLEKKEERIIAFEPRAAVSRALSSSSTQHLPANPRTRKDVHVS